MLSPHNLYPYQRKIADHIIKHPNAMVWADMGLGKTVSTLTALLSLRDAFAVTSVLVVAPKRVCQMVWRQEARKWSHTRGLRFSLVIGTEAQRLVALKRKADIYLINPENVPWLASRIEHLWLRKHLYPPMSMVVYDEITRFKSSGTKRLRAWSKILPYFSRRIGLTGEPAANGYKDLYGQYLVVDAGQRLGSSITAYRDAFLRPAGYMGREWECTRTGREQIHKRIADITLELSAKDYLDLPPLVFNTVWVDLPPTVRKVYDKLEKEFFAELDSGADLEVANEASKGNKLCQIASGAVYLSVGGPWERVHDEKLEALQELLDASQGRPMLLGYTYVHEAQRIAYKWPEDVEHSTGASFLSAKLREAEFNEILARWDTDRVPLLCGHPASMGHGLNLQGSSARSVVWFSLPWSLELYHQMNDRLFGGHRRQGASTVHHILAKDTVDETIYQALQDKDTSQTGLKKAIRAYRERRGV